MIVLQKHMGQMVTLYRGTIKKVFSRKDLGSGLCQTSIQTSSILQVIDPFYAPFCLFFFCSAIIPFPCTFPHQFPQLQGAPATPWTLRFVSISSASFWFTCSFLIAHQSVWLTRLISSYCLPHICLFCLLFSPSYCHTILTRSLIT